LPLQVTGGTQDSQARPVSRRLSVPDKTAAGIILFLQLWARLRINGKIKGANFLSETPVIQTVF
jgi:hypothetical protein